MFKELAPLLRQRPVVLLLNPLEGDTLRVIVMPKKLNDTEDSALATPVSVTGTPAELDEQLPATLTQFVGAHLELKNTLQMAKDQMDAAAKAARSKKYPKAETTKANANTPATDKKPADVASKSAAENKSAPSTTANLFSFDENPAVVEMPQTQQKTLDEESEILSEVEAETVVSPDFEDAA